MNLQSYNADRNHDDELEQRSREQWEHETCRNSGLSLHEASHMTPAQIQAVAIRNMSANIAAAKANAELDLDRLEAAARRGEIPDVRPITKEDLAPIYAALKSAGHNPVYAGGAGWCIIVLNADVMEVERVAKENATLPVTLKPAGNYTSVELTAPKRYYQENNYAR